MSVVKKIEQCVIDPKTRFYYATKLGFYNHLDDVTYLKKKFRLNIGIELDLENPQTFNEKLQWLKLYDRKDIYTTMVDKYEAKKYVADIIGEEYIIPTLGVYDKFEEVDFNKLPKQFVMKCTHNSGGIVICRDKAKLNKRAAKKKIEKAMKRNYYYSCRDWPYKNVKPRIIVEDFIKDDMTDDLRDYKFMCFNGKPEYVYITVKNDDIFEDYYDMNFRLIDINHGFRRSEIDFKKPELFDKMVGIVKKLSEGVPFLRVDLHYVNGKVLFGEMTFYDWGGLRPFSGDGGWDKKLGNLIDLDLIRKKKF